MKTLNVHELPSSARNIHPAQPLPWLNLAKRQPLLALTVATNLALLVIALAGMIFDPRMVLGASTWAKTAKFTVSVALYAGTLLWVLGQIRQRPRLVSFISNATGAILLLEISIIVLQAARGVPSHFNASSALDGALFSIMGVGITSLWIVDAVAFVLLLRERLQTRAMTWAVRLGLFISLIGMALAFFMTVPNATQMAALQAGQKLSMIGAHNVNALADGQTRMIPFLGWNRDGGDLRIAHFIGLHAIQIIPLLALWLERRRLRWLSDDARTALVVVASATYLGATLLSLWQALRNESIASPGALTLAGLAIVLSLAAAATAAIIARARQRTSRDFDKPMIRI